MKTPILTIQKFTRQVRSFAPGLPKRRRWFFRIRAENNEIIASSEAYNTARARNKTVALLVAGKMEVGK